MIPKSTYKSFFNAIYSVILSKEKSNKTSVEKLASTFGITDKNTIKEITETAIVTIARKIANQQNKSVKQKYDEIVDLYKSQVNLSHRTSQSMLLQQYSTPATIGFLMGIYCKIDHPGNYYEHSAGNGMLTIANSGKDFTVNEIDGIRGQNLEFQDVFKLITKTDSSKETYRSKYFDAVITNPPFSTLNKDENLILGEYEIKHLDHKMAILALNSMKDTGKAAIIVGGHTSWDDKGRIQAGKNRIFLSYLYKNYNVEDIILIDGNALYSKMGTGFDTRIILINGRKPKLEGFAPLKNDVLAQVITTTDDLYSRFSKHFDKNIAPMKKTLRLRAKAVSIKQKQLLELGQLGKVNIKETIIRSDILRTMPQAIIHYIAKNFDDVYGSPFSSSFYSQSGQTWDYTPKGQIRVADHWNFWSRDYNDSRSEMKQHAITDIPVMNNDFWTIAKKNESGKYEVILSIHKINMTIEEIRNSGVDKSSKYFRNDLLANKKPNEILYKFEVKKSQKAAYDRQKARYARIDNKKQWVSFDRTYSEKQGRKFVKMEEKGIYGILIKETDSFRNIAINGNLKNEVKYGKSTLSNYKEYDKKPKF